MKFSLELTGNKCNNEYPQLSVTHNQETIYSGYVKEKDIITIDIELQEHNVISLAGIGKADGKDGKWDTVVDSAGIIVEDKNLLIHNIWFDGIPMSDQWLNSLPFYHLDETTALCNKGMWDNGRIEFNINLPLLDWIIQEKFIKFSIEQSAKNDYNSSTKFNYKYIQEKINLINKLLR